MSLDVERKPNVFALLRGMQHSPVSRSLLPLEELFDYYQDLELDAIRAKDKLTIEHENHPADRVRQIGELSVQELVFFNLAKANWMEGKFDEVPVMYQRYDQ